MAPQNLVKIVPQAIELGEIPFNLYASDSRQGVVLLCRAGYSLSLEQHKALEESGRNFYVGGDEVSAYQNYANKRLNAILATEGINTKKKTELIKSLSELTLKNLFKDPRSSKAMENSGEFVHSYIDMIINSDVAIDNLFMLSTNSAFSLAHSINVCTFSILVGEYLYGMDHEKLWKLGLGALLMDIGMCIMDRNVLDDDHKFDEKEKKLLRLHTVKSEEIMKEHGLPEEMQLMGRNHHERADGSGYPDKLLQDKIPDLAKIGAVVDVYDAMTTDRKYRKTKTHYQALAEMSLEKHLYDHRILEILMKIVLQNDQLVREFMMGGKNVQKLCATA